MPTESIASTNTTSTNSNNSNNSNNTEAIVADLTTHLDMKNVELELHLTADKIENMLRVLRASDIMSRDAFTGLTIDELNEVMTSCQPPLPIGLRRNLRAIHK